MKNCLPEARQKTRSDNSRKWTVLVDATLPGEVVSRQRSDLVLIDSKKKHLLLGKLMVA